MGCSETGVLEVLALRLEEWFLKCAVVVDELVFLPRLELLSTMSCLLWTAVMNTTGYHSSSHVPNNNTLNRKRIV
jgi:hypothetical protein